MKVTVDSLNIRELTLLFHVCLVLEINSFTLALINIRCQRYILCERRSYSAQTVLDPLYDVTRLELGDKDERLINHWLMKIDPERLKALAGFDSPTNGLSVSLMYTWIPVASNLPPTKLRTQINPATGAYELMGAEVTLESGLSGGYETDPETEETRGAVYKDILSHDLD